MSKPKVVILGGGVAGLSAAHELAERGYEVTIYEKKKEIGGKAKSLSRRRGTDLEPKAPKAPLEHDIPVEHGFRFFPGFYQHLTDTMKRIPFPDNKEGVFSNLVNCPKGMIARYGKKPIIFPTAFPPLWQMFRFYNQIKDSGLGLKPGEKTLFIRKVWQLMSSSPSRINNEYEAMSWTEYMEDDANKSDSYKSLFIAGLTRTLVAAKANKMSTKTGGNTFIQLVYDILKPWSYGADRVLKGPTKVMWMDPWYNHLKKSGVKIETDWTVTNIQLAEGKISGITIINKETEKTVGDDHCIYIMAMPIEDVHELIKSNNELKKAENAFEHFEDLAKCTAWMTGIQFYITEEMAINHGHVIYADSDWAVTSISQLEFWDKDWVAKNIDKDIKHILSVDVSDWYTPSRFGKKLVACDTNSKQEIKDEVLQQINASLEKCHNVKFDDKINVLTYYLDHSITIAQRTAEDPNDDDNLETINEDPLLVNEAGTWKMRPDAVTKIPNLFLAADYVKTNTDLATMEGANEAARKAVNGILDFTQDKSKRCKTFALFNPWILWPFQFIDRVRYKMNSKNSYSLGWSMVLAFLILPLLFFWFLLSVLNIITASRQIAKQYSKEEEEKKSPPESYCETI